MYLLYLGMYSSQIDPPPPPPAPLLNHSLLASHCLGLVARACRQHVPQANGERRC